MEYALYRPFTSATPVQIRLGTPNDINDLEGLGQEPNALFFILHSIPHIPFKSGLFKWEIKNNNYLTEGERGGELEPPFRLSWGLSWVPDRV